VKTIVLISLGAIAGANLRYAVALTVSRFISGFPLGTLVVNVTGSIAIGLFFALAGRAAPDPRWVLLAAGGFCGGYTTFSSFAFETVSLLEEGRWAAAVANIAASNALCLLGVLVGAKLGRTL
jgi:fluoride exporter